MIIDPSSNPPHGGFLMAKESDIFSDIFISCRYNAFFAEQAFVLFFLDGMKATIEHLHDRINDMTKVLLFTYRLAEALQTKVLNRRQHTLVRLIMDHPGQYTRKTLTEIASYQMLYQKVTDRTERRDWLGLVDWLDADSDKHLYPRW